MSDDSHPSRRYDYIDFSLEIRKGDDRNNYVVAASSPEGEVQEQTRLPFDDWELKDKLNEVEVALLRSMGLRRRIGTPEEETIRAFGRALFETVFVGDVDAYYRMSLREARRQNRGLRLKLRIGPPELSALPWEFIYDPRRDYVGLSSRTPLVRSPDVPQPVERLTVTPPLSILGMVTSPRGVPQLDIAHEKRLVEEALRGLQSEGLVELTWLGGQTWNDLKRAMRRGTWHVFHFIGHGGFDPETEEGAIALSDAEGRLHLLGANDLALLLDDHLPFLRLVFLNSCEGAKGSPRDSFSSTATTLVRSGIPAVVAMQYEITDEAAIDFSRAFYEALADGLPVDAAVAEARTAVKIRSALEWGSPVLYMRSPNGRIFDIKAIDEHPAGWRHENAEVIQDNRDSTAAKVQPVGEHASNQEPASTTADHAEHSASQPGQGVWRRGILAALAILLAGAIFAAGVFAVRGFGLFDEHPASSMADASHKQEAVPSESHRHTKPSKPSGNDPYVAGGDAEASSNTLPEEKGPLPPGEYKSTVFDPGLTFRVVEEGWELRHPEFSDVIGLRKGDIWLAFLNVQQVYPESKMGHASPVPAPNNMAEWIRNHAYLAASDEQTVRIGGESGIQFGHVDPYTAHDEGLCKYVKGEDTVSIPCVRLFYMHAADENQGTEAHDDSAAMHMQGMAYPLREGEGARIIILPNVEGERVLILVQGTDEALEKLLPEVENLLDTVQWKH